MLLLCPFLSLSTLYLPILLLLSLHTIFTLPSRPYLHSTFHTSDDCTIKVISWNMISWVSKIHHKRFMLKMDTSPSKILVHIFMTTCGLKSLTNMHKYFLLGLVSVFSLCTCKTTVIKWTSRATGLVPATRLARWPTLASEIYSFARQVVAKTRDSSNFMPEDRNQDIFPGRLHEHE